MVKYTIMLNCSAGMSTSLLVTKMYRQQQRKRALMPTFLQQLQVTPVRNWIQRQLTVFCLDRKLVTCKMISKVCLKAARTA